MRRTYCDACGHEIHDRPAFSVNKYGVYESYDICLKCADSTGLSKVAEDIQAKKALIDAANPKPAQNETALQEIRRQMRG